MESGFQRRVDGHAVGQFFFHAGEDDDIGVHGHTNAEDDTRDTRQGQSDVKRVQQHEHKFCINDKRQAGCESGRR